MKALTGAERIFTTLEHQEPERVPHFENHIWPNVIEKIRPNSTYFDLVDYLDLDAVVVVDSALLPGYRIETPDPSHVRDQWGVVWRVIPDARHNLEGPIKSEKDLDAWTVPDPDEPWRYELLTELVGKYKGQKAIIAGFQDPFNIANSIISLCVLVNVY